MFTWLRKGLFLIILLTAPAIYGQIQPPYCPGEIGLAVEWLYMYTSYTDTIYGNKTTTQDANSITVVNVQDFTGWHSGYRIDLSYSFDHCNDIRLRWTHFPCFSSTNTTDDRFTSQDIIDINTVLPAIGSSGFVKDRIHLYYLDLLMGFNLIDNCFYRLILQGGPQYLHFKFKQEDRIFGVNAANPNPRATFISDLWGVGPELGFDFSYFFCKSLNLSIRSYNSLLVSKRVPSLSSIDTNGLSVFETTQSRWHVLPFIDARMGLGYNGCCAATVPLNYTFEVGYEILWLYSSIDRTNESSVATNTMSYNLHGPYLRAGATF